MDSANAASAASPRNKSSLAQRIVSAVVLLPIVVAVVWWSVWSVAVFVAIVVTLGVIELFGALRQGGYRPRLSVGLGSAFLVALALLFRPFFAIDLVTAAI